eukprot:2694849-Rhodomonas_salina.1
MTAARERELQARTTQECAASSEGAGKSPIMHNEGVSHPYGHVQVRPSPPSTLDPPPSVLETLGEPD